MEGKGKGGKRKEGDEKAGKKKITNLFKFSSGKFSARLGRIARVSKYLGKIWENT